MHKQIYYIFIVLAVITAIALSACSSAKSSSSSQLLGKYQISEWVDKSSWDKAFYNSSEFTAEQIRNFKNLVEQKDIKFTIFASSSCNECANSLPYFLKLVELSGIEKVRVTLIGLNDYWEEPGNSHKKFNISEIPVVFMESKGKSRPMNKLDFMNYDKIMEIVNAK